jgi:dihydrofolate reductase
MEAPAEHQKGSTMGKIVVHSQMTVNGAFDSPSPETWLELDADSGDAALEQLLLADALLLGRKTYEGLAAVWPLLGDDPTMGRFAGRINAMPKYVASRTLTGPLQWNATLIHGDLDRSVPALKTEHGGSLIVSGCGEFAHDLTRLGLVDEFWFWVNPHLWPTGPRIFDDVGPIRLQLVAATPFRSGVLWLRYRTAID